MSASSLEYLIPISPMSPLSSAHGHLVVGDDMAIDLTSNVKMASTHANTRSMIFKDKHQGQDMIVAFDQLGATGVRPLTHEDSWWTLQFNGAIDRMWSRDNCVVSDRLAILANASSLRRTLKSTELRQLAFGYKTCLLALVYANIWPEADQRWAQYRKLTNTIMPQTQR